VHSRARRVDTRAHDQVTEIMVADGGVDAQQLDDARRALHDKGIDDLTTLIRRTLARNATQNGVGELLVTAIPKARRAAPPTPSAIRHRPPECPLFIDGVAHDPADIVRYDGTPLHMTVTETADGVCLHAFTHDVTIQALTALFAMRVLDWGTPPGGGPSQPGQQGPSWPPTNGCGFMGMEPCYPPSRPPSGSGGSGGSSGGGGTVPAIIDPMYQGTVCIFEHVDYHGDWFWVESGRVYSDLTEVSRNTTLWWSDDWNDTISSMSMTNDHMLYSEHTHQQGNTLYLKPNTKVRELVSIGWNDRISSVWNYGPTA
jgi:hypothetical protein